MLEPQFLPGSRGALFALYHPSHSTVRRESLLYIHPFAEELNKSRRMVALQARRLAKAGFAVLLVDLYGCGDSGGDFAEARWSVWKADLRLCAQWLRARREGPLYLWGLRLGGMLAAELAGEVEAARLLLWQPVLEGRQLLTQFLRLRLAAAMLGENRETTAQLRARLAAGHSLEIAGYELHPELAAALEQGRLQPPPAAGIAVDWLELAAGPDPALAPASRRLVAQWQAAGIPVNARAVAGEPFWSSQEITLAPELLAATQTLLEASC